MDLYEHLLNAVHRLGTPHISVGLSGGVDSVVLLHLLHRAQKELPFQLNAIHIHHGLQTQANDWADACKHLCQQYNIPIIIQKVDVDKRHLGIEAAAREARYQAFRQHTTHTLALAHHANDQSETFLLAAMRGGGLRALSAMTELYQNKGLSIWRPLLKVPRSDIERYAAQHHLPYHNDPSNHDISLLRNWLRQNWLPCAEQRLPHLHQQLHASIESLQDELSLLNEISELDWNTVTANGFFDCAIWQDFSSVRRRNLLLLFAKYHQLGSPRRAAIADFERVLTATPLAAEWRLPFGWGLAFRGKLVPLHDDFKENAAWLRTPNGISGTFSQISQMCKIKFKSISYGLNPEILNTITTIRPVLPNDTITTPNGHRSVKKILAEQGIPARLRKLYPIVLSEQGECLAVVGVRIAHTHSIKQGIMPQLIPPFPFGLHKN